MEYRQGRAVGGGSGLLCGDEEERFRSAFGMTGLLFLVLKVGSRRTEEKSAGLQTRHCPGMTSLLWGVLRIGRGMRG
jgi:hypothetical protein